MTTILLQFEYRRMQKVWICITAKHQGRKNDPKSGLASPDYSGNLSGLVLGCSDADFWKSKIFFAALFKICAPLHRPKVKIFADVSSIPILFSQKFGDLSFFKMLLNVREIRWCSLQFDRILSSFRALPEIQITVGQWVFEFFNIWECFHFYFWQFGQIRLKK